MVDRDQIIYKLKSAIEESKLPQFETECNENITQIDTYIKVTLNDSWLIFRNCVKTTTWSFFSLYQVLGNSNKE